MPPLWINCLLLSVLALPANAESDGFAVPGVGLVFHSGSHSIRPILGVPGASRLGDAVIDGVSAAWIAPGGKWAFAITTAHAGFLRNLSSRSLAETDAAGLMDAIDRVIWNSGGSAAVLYSSSSNRLQRVRLENQLSVEDPFDLTPWGKPSSIVLDPAGGRVAFAVPGAGVFMMDGTQSPSLVAAVAHATIAFSDTGKLYAVDADTRRILAFDDSLNPLDFALDAPENTTFEPVGLAISGADKYLLVADRGARTVRVYEIATRMLTDTLGLNLAPAHLQRLSLDPIFLLNRPRGKEWLLVLDATETPRVYFVPAGEEEAR